MILESLLILYLIKSLLCPLMQYTNDNHNLLPVVILYLVTAFTLYYSYHGKNKIRNTLINVVVVHYVFYVIVTLLVSYILLTFRFNKYIADVSVMDILKLPLLPIILMFKC